MFLLCLSVYVVVALVFSRWSIAEVRDNEYRAFRKDSAHFAQPPEYRAFQKEHGHFAQPPEYEEKLGLSVCLGLFMGFVWPALLVILPFAFLLTSRTPKFKRELRNKEREKELDRREQEIRDWKPPTLEG